MSKRKTPSRRPYQAARSRAVPADSRRLEHGEEAARGKPRSWVPSSAAIRETIESVVIAFVLAFLFRTFEAEAFVIPTGSMAMTLMGRHKDLVCQKCGYRYQVSASEEVDSETGARNGRSVESCTCPMCRYTMHLGHGEAAEKEYPSYKGDRILVGKFCYEFGDPERWDVVVFKYPGEAKINFIKRLVGLPNETVRISHGDIFVDKEGDGSFLIERKPPRKLLAMLQPVFDNDYAAKIVAQGWPPRWGPGPRAESDSAGGWQTSSDYRWFETDGTAPGPNWLRYQHLVPSTEDWRRQEAALGGTGRVSRREPKPRLISDFCAYNTGRSTSLRTTDPYDSAAFAYEQSSEGDEFGDHWVGDLALRCTLEVRSDSGQVVFELVEGGRPMQCRIDLATGTATLTIAGTDSEGLPARTSDGRDYCPSGQTKVRGRGKYEIIFANVDDQLRLWVDGSLVSFGGSDEASCYAPLNNFVPRPGGAASDLSPVGIASEGAALRLSDLKILRDIYYIAVRNPPRGTERITDLEGVPRGSNILADPKLWGAFARARHADFPLHADEFLVLGDNSAKSKDSRLWEQEGFEYYVKRELLTGKALYIYWPHSWNKVPGTNIPFPLFPNFARMGFVR